MGFILKFLIFPQDKLIFTIIFTLFLYLKYDIFILLAGCRFSYYRNKAGPRHFLKDFPFRFPPPSLRVTTQNFAPLKEAPYVECG